MTYCIYHFLSGVSQACREQVGWWFVRECARAGRSMLHGPIMAWPDMKGVTELPKDDGDVDEKC
jgi:hypothetical protein